MTKVYYIKTNLLTYDKLIATQTNLLTHDKQITVSNSITKDWQRIMY